MEISLVQQRHLTMVGKCNMGASTMDAISRTFMFILLEEKGFECFFLFFFRASKMNFTMTLLFIPNNGFRLHSTYIKSMLRNHMIQKHGTKQNRIIVLQVAY